MVQEGSQDRVFSSLLPVVFGQCLLLPKCVVIHAHYCQPWKPIKALESRGFSFFPIIYLFIYFNWRLITLQYCIGFAIQWHESAMGVHVFPILKPPPNSLPSGSSQCTSPEHLVSCIEPGLAIHFLYDNIDVSMLFSQIIPPLPSPTEFNSLFFTSVSLLLSRI